MKKPAQWAVGLMTGTVLDGNIDVALLKTDGEHIESFGQYTLAPYTSGTLALLREALDMAQGWQFEGPEPSVFASAEKQLTLEQSGAVSELLKQAGLNAHDVAAIGFHGQTVLHQPPVEGRIGQTRQLGDGRLMAERLGIRVVNDLRQADMQAGGQGAPLSPVYHRALLKKLHCSNDTAVLNLGGVANLTWWDGDQQLIGFDTGPANAPINDFIVQKGLGTMDADGKLANQGKVDEERLQQALKHPYLYEPYPKSLDRFDFGWQLAEGLSAEDGAALLTAFSASAVGKALDLLPVRRGWLIVCGGGRHNPALMQAISCYAKVDVLSAEDVGWRGDAIEAECFAFLAMRSVAGLALSFPGTTGVAQPACGGVVHIP